jgi:pyrrolidone-carboxylate peptidase
MKIKKLQHHVVRKLLNIQNILIIGLGQDRGQNRIRIRKVNQINLSDKSKSKKKEKLISLNLNSRQFSSRTVNLISV